MPTSKKSPTSFITFYFAMLSRISALALIAIPSLVLAQNQPALEPSSLPAPDQPVEAPTPQVEKINDSQYRIGKVTLNPKTREIRFPAKINMAEGLLEFLIAHEKGKLHECLLVTDTSPTHINLAFTVLRYPASRELYALPNETGGLSGNFPVVPDEIKAAARISIDVEWDDQGTIRRIPINEWVQNTSKSTAMPAGPWVYGASVFSEGRYAPEITGDIAAIFVAPSAIINYPGTDNQDDTVWIAFPKRVPPEGTNVTVIIAPYSKNQTLPTP